MRPKVAIGVMVVLLALNGYSHAADSAVTPSAKVPPKVAADAGTSDIVHAPEVIAPNITVIINQPAAGGTNDTPAYIDTALSITQSAESYMESTLTILTLIVSIIGIIIALALGVLGLYFQLYKKKIDLRMKKLESCVQQAQEHVEATGALKEKASSLLEGIEKKSKLFKGMSVGDELSDAEKTTLADIEKESEEVERSGGKLPLDAYSALATKAYYDKDYEKALSFINKAIESAPMDAVLWSNKGATLVELDRPEDALLAFDKAIELKPDYPNAWSNKGAALAKLGHHEDALLAFDKAIELKPDYPEAWSNKGAALAGIDRNEDALRAFDMAITLKPDYPEAWYNKGITLVELDRLDKVLQAFDKAIELKPDYPNAWSNKGNALVELGHNEDALRAYDKAIELKPDYADAWYNKGTALAGIGRPDEALLAYDKAITLKPDYASAYFNRACAYALKGERDKALSDLGRAIELDGKFRQMARQDDDFESMLDDGEFKRLTAE